MTRLIRATVSLLLVLPVFLLGGCLVIKDSPAPGCVKSIGLPMSGGCFGKTALLDLTVEPENACLAIKANNCNGGVLEVDNSCQEILVLDRVEIPSSSCVSLDVIEEADGTFSLSQVSSNLSSYVSQQDKRITLTGWLGNQEIEVTFTKTAKLCE